MIRTLFLENLSLWSCVWQSTLLIVIGLTGGHLFRHRPARAFQILLLAMIAAALVPHQLGGLNDLLITDNCPREIDTTLVSPVVFAQQSVFQAFTKIMSLPPLEEQIPSDLM